MARRRGFAGSRGRPGKRPVDWVSVACGNFGQTMDSFPVGDDAVSDFATSAFVCSLLGPEASSVVKAMTNPTLVRSRLQLVTGADITLSAAFSGNAFIAAGIMVATNEAIAQGALPSPFLNADWLWYSSNGEIATPSGRMSIQLPLVGSPTSSPLALVDTQAADETSPGYLDVDSKAMRKLRENEQGLALVTGVAVSTTAGNDLSGSITVDYDGSIAGRMLFKDG